MTDNLAGNTNPADPEEDWDEVVRLPHQIRPTRKGAGHFNSAIHAKSRCHAAVIRKMLCVLRQTARPVLEKKPNIILQLSNKNRRITRRRKPAYMAIKKVDYQFSG